MVGVLPESNSIVFVCKANQCRSPIAAGIFRAKFIDQSQQHMWRIGSAGTWARNGLPVLQEVASVMSDWDIDVSGHRSRMVSREILKSYSLVLCMEPGQKEALTIEFPEFCSRIHMLGEMDGSGTTITDPVGGPLEDYQLTAELIYSILVRGRDRIISLAVDAFIRKA